MEKNRKLRVVHINVIGLYQSAIDLVGNACGVYNGDRTYILWCR